MNSGNHNHGIGYTHHALPPKYSGGYVWNPSSPLMSTKIEADSIWNKVISGITINNNLNNLKENETMETLYQVTVVTKKKVIIQDIKLVAVDQENAKFNSGLYDVLKREGLTPDDVTVLVSVHGSVKVEK